MVLNYQYQIRDHIIRLLHVGYYILYMLRRLVPACDIGIVSVFSRQGCLVRVIFTPWNNNLWCNDLYLYGSDVRFTTQ